MKLEVGQGAPEFALADQGGRKVLLSSFRYKRNVALVFCPFAFSSVCEFELSELRDEAAMFEKFNTQLIVVSCDSTFALSQFAVDHGFEFPLLSDFWPHGQVARTYRVFNEALGCANRDTFVIDKLGQVANWFSSADLGTARDISEYEKAVAHLP